MRGLKSLFSIFFPSNIGIFTRKGKGFVFFGLYEPNYPKIHIFFYRQNETDVLIKGTQCFPPKRIHQHEKKNIEKKCNQSS